MDPIIVAAIITLMAGSLAGLMTLRGSRGQAVLLAGDSFRDDLLARITQQDTKISSLESRCDRLAESNDQLREDLSERDAHIIVLTEWGKWSEAPVPRTEPHWRTRD